MGELSDILKGWDKPKDEQAGAPKPKPKPKPEVLPPTPQQEGERKVSLGDVAKARKDYEREPLDKK